MFLNASQQKTLQRIVNDKARCDNARLYNVVCSMLPRDIVRSGNIAITEDGITITVKGAKKKDTQTQIVNLKN